MELISQVKSLNEEHKAIKKTEEEKENDIRQQNILKLRAIKVYDQVPRVVLLLSNQMKMRFARFGTLVAIVLIENAAQMALFYDDQLSMGLTWSWLMPMMPMLSNVLFSKFCASIGTNASYFFQNSQHYNKIYYSF